MDRFDPRGSVNRALLVGVSAYESIQPKDPHGVPGDLGAVDHNLSPLADALRRGGVFREDEIAVSRSPTLDAFTQSLRTAAAEAEELLLFYFAGHAAVPSAGDELWLQMRNARVVAGSHAVFPGADPFSSVLAVLATSRAKHVVVVLDCCNAGNAARVWEALGQNMKRRFSVLMSVQANNRIDAGDDTTPTPFTARLVELLDQGVDGRDTVGFQELSEALTAYMTAQGHKTLRDEPWEPQSRTGTPETDILLASRTPDPPGPTECTENTVSTENTDSTNSTTEPRWWRRLPAGFWTWLGTALSAARLSRILLPPRWSRRTVAWAAALAVAALGLAGYLAFGGTAADQSSCGPPLELRLLTDPDIESSVRKAADAYLTSGANTTAGGCRRSGITVYSAGASDVVTAFRDQSDPWQRPVSDDLDPQRDIGPQPDIWIPATAASVDRARPAEVPRKYVTLERDASPFAYSPMVLSVPQGIAEAGVSDRTGGTLATLLQKLKQQDTNAGVRRTDPEYTDSALLATIGLYGTGNADVSKAEAGVRQSGPPSLTGADLLCALPAGKDVDNRTAALVPEFLTVSGTGCSRTTRAPRMAEYPDDVPGLDPLFVRVRWDDADRDKAARDDAVARFHDWLTGGGGTGGKGGGKVAKGGLAVFGADGFRSPSGSHGFLGTPGENTGVLADPGPLTYSAPADTMTTALQRYRNAHGPGRVLFLLDSSGSMGALWEGTGGAPGILKQSLAGLGDQDEYGVWAVASKGGSPYGELLPFGTHKRAEAEKTIDQKATVQDAEADPYGALKAALAEMAARGKDDNRPQLIVWLTDDEDNNHLTAGGKLDQLLKSPHVADVPVAVAALDSGGCDTGKPDRRISDKSGGRCLDTKGDLGTGLRDEVARTGTGDQ